MDASADALIGPVLVNPRVREGVGGGVHLALDALALQVADDHVLGRELVVVDAGRLDDEQPRLRVELGGVAPGKDNQPVLGQVHIRLVDLLA